VSSSSPYSFDGEPAPSDGFMLASLPVSLAACPGELTQIGPPCPYWFS